MSATQSEVLIVSRHYAPEPTGSAPVIQEIAEWLAGDGQAVRVLTVRPNYPGTEVFDGYRNGEKDRAVENGVRVTRLATRPVRGAGLMARLGPESRFFVDVAAGAVLDRFAPADQVISLCPSILTSLGALMLVRRRGRHVAIVHDIQSGLGSALGSGGLKVILPLLRRIEAFTLNRTDHVIVLSEAMKAALVELGVRRPISVLPPSIDTRRIVPAARPDAAPPTLLYSGNLGRKQGLEQLVDLAEVLARRAPQVRMVIRGDGAMRESLTEDVGRRGLANVGFSPLAPKAQLSSALAEGDVHLVPQVASGGDFAVPSKVFAIMAAARPFVATAEPDSPLGRLAQASGAFVCTPPQAPDAFADAVLGLLDDAPRREAMGRQGRAYVEREVDTDVVMRRLAPLLAKQSKKPINSTQVSI
jgi:colanic acid biosynthesis glycosyl transferase WcaI